MGDLLRFDAARLRILLERHHLLTGSERARSLLEDWDSTLGCFIKIMPKDYRRALFDYLLDSAGYSPASLREAAALLDGAPASDPDTIHMRWRLEREGAIALSGSARFDRVFLAIPRAAYLVVHK